MTDQLGKYEVRSTLGKGASGTVYEAWDPHIARRVAIKTVVLPDTVDPEVQEQIDRFRREAQAAGRLHHPNVVGIFDYGETAELAYIVMEYVDGESMKAILDRHEPIPVPEALRLMRELLAGLSYSHAAGVVHRDIKPANLMLTRDGQIKIADFGIARIENSGLTQVGAVMGTPAYMSPEQISGQPVDSRADIYSAGVVFYQLLTGERPFEGGMSSVMQKALTIIPPKPSLISVTAPTILDDVVLKAMAKRPEDRYSSAAEFSAALMAAMKKAIQATPPDEATFVMSAGGGAMEPAAATFVRSGPAAVQERTLPASPPEHETVQAPPAMPPRRAGSRLPLMAGVAVLTAVVAGVGFISFQSPKPGPPAGTAAPTSQFQPSSTGAGSKPSAIVNTAPPALTPTPVTPPPISEAKSEPPRENATIDTKPVTRTPATVETKVKSPAAVAAEPQPSAQPPLAAQGSLPPNPAPVPTQPPATAPAPALAPLPVPATGPAIVPAPVPSPTLQAAAGQSPLSLTSIAATLRLAPCALARANIGEPDSVVRVDGMAGRDAADPLRRALATAASGATVVMNLHPIPDTTINCRILDLVRPLTEASGESGQRMRLDLGEENPRLAAGAPIRLAVEMPDFPAQLWLDYFSSDGRVSHIQSPGAASLVHAAGAAVKPGSAGVIGNVEKPYGFDMILGVSTSTSLFVRPRPAPVEDSEVYLRDLQTAIDGVKRRGGKVSAAAIGLETTGR